MTEQKFKAIGSSILSPLDNKKRKEIFITKPTKAIKKLFWTYGEDEQPISVKSRFYVDLNLHAETDNYTVGEIIKVVIESEDGENVSQDSKTITLFLTVGNDGHAKMRNVFQSKRIELFSQEYV